MMAREPLCFLFLFIITVFLLSIACEQLTEAEVTGAEREQPEVLALRWEVEVAEAPLTLRLERVYALAEAPDPAKGLLLEHRLRLQALRLRCGDLHLHDPTLRGAQERDTCAERLESARQELKRLQEEPAQRRAATWTQRLDNLDDALDELDSFINARLAASQPPRRGVERLVPVASPEVRSYLSGQSAGVLHRAR